MATFILLTQTDRDHVRGQSVIDPTAFLEPVQRQGGGVNPDPVFILNVLVLSDPAHETYWAYLDALPKMAITDPDFPPELPEE